MQIFLIGPLVPQLAVPRDHSQPQGIDNLRAGFCGASMGYALAPQTQLPPSILDGGPADMKAEGFRTIMVYCVARPIGIPAPAAGTILWCRWWTPRLGLVRYLRTFEVHAVRLGWVGRSASELV